MNKKNIFVNLIFIISFFAILGYITIYNFTNLKEEDVDLLDFEPILKTYSADMTLASKDLALKNEINLKENAIKENFVERLSIIEAYGHIKMILNKKMVDDPLRERYVYKGENGFLYYAAPKRTNNALVVKNILSLQNMLIKEGIPFAVVLAPNKHNIESQNFPKGVVDYNPEITRNLHALLYLSNITCLNLTIEFYKDKLSEESSFYLTDTHWKFETAFWGYTKLLNLLEKKYSFKYDNISSDLKNYDILEFKDTYIGSMGKRAGEKFIDKKDDVRIPIPKFNTSYKYQKYDEYYNKIIEKNGTYKDVFYNESIMLSDDIYKDKYTAIMDYGEAFEIIENNNINDNSKIILIKDSFAMPVCSYLAANFQTVYMVDTRFKNIKATLYQKIKEINPDYVVMFFSPTCITFFPEMFDF